MYDFECKDDLALLDLEKMAQLGRTVANICDAAMLEVTVEELVTLIQRLAAKNTASGPNGVLGWVWVLVQDVLGDGLRQLFDRCLETGRFPST